MTVDHLRSPIKKADEFSIFSTAINGLATNRQNELGLIFGQLNGEQNKQLKTLLQTKRVQIQAGAPQQQSMVETQKEARVIVKAKRRPPKN